MNQIKSLTFSWDLESIALLTFAILFFSVGIARIIEFKHLGLKTKTYRVLIFLHILGCLCFSLSLILGAINLHQDCQTLTFSAFILSMTLLAPGQFTIGIKKRRIERESQMTQSPSRSCKHY